MGDFAFFKLISEYFDHKIDQFGLRLMARMMQWVGAISLTLVTLWVMIAGYRMATGQSRDSMMALVVSMTRIAVILSVATSMAWGGTNLHRFVTVDLDREIHSLFVGSAQSSSDAIDKNLAFPLSFWQLVIASFVARSSVSALTTDDMDVLAATAAH
ncbi:type IV secretion system protein [Lysobacter capsici]|nr:type IV secretion system protein [Lysobacter capsici]WND82998.1 type IV secretion system protein [Lysobacter capsici]WND88197.1 type IV secretion system protein [Lysobacter capsici]